MTKIGALIYRRADHFWTIDEFDHDGRHLGSHGGNHLGPQLIGFRNDIEWPDEVTRLNKLAITGAPFFADRKRVGLVRCIDGAAQRRAA